MTIPANRLCSNSERGLLGIAVDPNFASNNYIYIYYTYNRVPNSNCPTRDFVNGPVNRVSRFVLPANNVINVNWSTTPATGETVLLDNIPSFNGNHNGGDLHFGLDGLLYISVGDSACDFTNTSNCQDSNSNSRHREYLSGKILRINKDGSIPNTNPYVGTGGARQCGLVGPNPLVGSGFCTETYAWGLRNPFRFNFKPGSSTFYINDVGGGRWEEIDQGQLNADYGWNVCEGNHATGSDNPCTNKPTGAVAPIAEYSHNTGCSSITGGVFIPPGYWPAKYDNTYLYSDYVCGKIFNLDASNVSTDFVTGLGGSSAIDLQFGPYTPSGGSATQALYYSSYAAGGQIHVLYYSGSGVNRPPTAVIAANPLTGTLPLTVNFNGSGSSDPDNNPLTYIWNFGDGSPVTTTVSATISHQYTAKGPFTASLQVKDSNNALSNTATIKLYPGASGPTPQILTPVPSTRFYVGQVFTVSGKATDEVDGTLPASALHWVITRYHGTPTNLHRHPFMTVDGVASFVTDPAPLLEDFASAANSYLEIQLTAINSLGISTTITQNLLPHLVNLTFDTTPTGGSLTINGDPYSLPVTLTSWDNYIFPLTSLAPPANGGPYTFVSWSDGGAVNHSITTPNRNTSYNANFSINGCDALNVTDPNTTHNACGSFNYALGQAGVGGLIKLNLAGPLNFSSTLTIDKNVEIKSSGGCAAPVTLKAPQFKFSSGLSLFGINLEAPKTGRTVSGPIALFGTGGGQHLTCTKVLFK